MAKLFLLLSALLCITFAFPNKDASDSDLRIVGGQNATLGQFPWMVSLRDISDRHFCGGSIISCKWVLTAGHCTYEVIPGETSAVVGTISVTTSGDFYQVIRFILHEDFSLETAQNDVGLLELGSKIVFSENVQPIPLETEFVDIVDATVSGWGVLAYGGPHPDTLQYLDLKTISVEDCQQRMIAQAFPITDKQVCTFTVYGEGVCIDDSGSALVSDGRQIGFVSWGVPCAVGYPDIFVRVSAYVGWIKRNIRK